MLITINKKYTLLYIKFSPFYEARFRVENKSSKSRLMNCNCNSQRLLTRDVKRNRTSNARGCELILSYSISRATRREIADDLCTTRKEGNEKGQRWGIQEIGSRGRDEDGRLFFSFDISWNETIEWENVDVRRII